VLLTMGPSLGLDSLAHLAGFEVSQHLPDRTDMSRTALDERDLGGRERVESPLIRRLSPGAEGRSALATRPARSDTRGKQQGCPGLASSESWWGWTGPSSPGPPSTGQSASRGPQAPK